MSQETLQAQVLIGSILELLTSEPELVSKLNLTQAQDRETFKLTCDLSDKEAIASKVLPYLTKQVDNFTNVSSFDDYSNRDVVGSYPADDQRSGWWLISIGYTFLHLAIGYPDILIQQAVAAKELHSDDDTYVAPDEFEGLIIDIGEYELDRLLDIFAIVTAKPDDIFESDFVEIDALCRKYNREKVSTIQELLGDHLLKTSYLPQRSFLEVATYSPGVYVYSVDPLLEHTIENTVISIRRLDGTHYMYFFKNGILNREPPFRASTDLHKSIMQDD
jgi:hypothetical protein